MRRRRAIEWLLSAPTLLWLGVFFALPTLLIFALAFKPATINGNRPWANNCAKRELNNPLGAVK